MTTIKRRRRWCILEEFSWRIIQGAMSISKKYLAFCWEQKQTWQLETSQWRKIINTTTEMTTIERRIRWRVLKEFWKIIDGEMSISKGYHPCFGQQTKLDSFDTLRWRKIINTTTEMTTMERRRKWCILEEFWRIIDGGMSISKRKSSILWEQTKTGQFDILRGRKFAHTAKDMITIKR